MNLLSYASGNVSEKRQPATFHIRVAAKIKNYDKKKKKKKKNNAIVWYFVLLLRTRVDLYTI